MAEWRSIETAPKDGTWVLLAGGTREPDLEHRHQAVVAFWLEDAWVFAHWDSAWRSVYENPTLWAPLPAISDG